MRWRAAVLVAVVVIAGCSGVVGTDGTGDVAGVAVTPAPVPTDEPTPTELAPGLTADGVTDPSALAEAHSAATRGSYTVTGDRTVRYGNGSLRARRTMTVRLASNHSRHHVELAVSGPEAVRLLGPPPASAEFWSDGERYVRAYSRGNATTYNTYDPTVSPGGTLVGTSDYWVSIVVPGGQPWTDIRPLFVAFETRTVARQDGPRYAVASSRLADPDLFALNEDVRAPRNASLEAIVDGRGLVREYRLEYTADLGGSTVHVVRTVRYTGVGTTVVERPPWYDEAVDGTTDG